ncbi:hypothetical protein GALMADRAFT_214909 [Galerina marginata CBS 339.88]|uniref:FAD-binding domain-containing protein n=1 Tax=Galerina marginata (strain CBS 339.88) TaxID=685588 RepID=A0A067SFW7_GALM3|nr:hypothetical protein GALMADRAFT_214909 [Galerina marginata CBS 339.88]
MRQAGKSNLPHHARLPLDIALVGGGVGGLAAGYLLGRAGHKVTVFDGAVELGNIGAGIQLSPNVTRLLVRWGLGEKLREVGVVPSAFSMRRYKTGEVVGWKKWGETMEKEYGAPYYVIHRADLHRILLDNARPYINLRLNSMITDIDPSAPSITLKSGEIIKADLVIGADGIHSRVRTTVVGALDKPMPTGDAAYRALIPTSALLRDADLKGFVDDGANIWMGPNRHIVAYPIRNKELYNVVMAHPSTRTNEVTREVPCEVMRKDFVEFEPRIQKLLSLIDYTTVWALMDRRPLENWVHKDGKVCLLGDACHPMLPYRAQGAAMAVEDAAVLGNLLNRISKPQQLGPLLWAYQSIRYPRATAAQTESRMNQGIFHAPDGPEQEQRDASMREAMAAALREENGELGSDSIGSKNLWADKEVNDRTFGHDVDAEVEEWWRKHEREIITAGSKL